MRSVFHHALTYRNTARVATSVHEGKNYLMELVQNSNSNLATVGVKVTLHLS